MLRKFICKKLEKMYLMLINKTYSNLKFNKGVITYKACKSQIYHTIEYFGKMHVKHIFVTLYILDAPYSIEINMLFATQSLITDLVATHKLPFKVRYKKDSYHVILLWCPMCYF